MVKYGEFIVIIDETNGGILNKLYYKMVVNESCDSYYKYNTDIIYTFYDDPEQTYSDREMYTSTDDYEDLNMYFSKKLPDTPLLHPSTIHSLSCSMHLKIPYYDSKTSTYILNINALYSKILINNRYKLINSQFNCIYTSLITNKDLFSIAKIEASKKFPKFIFYYDENILTKKDIIYLIKKIICVDFN